MHTLAQHVMRRPSDTVSLFHHTTSLTIAMLSFMPHLTHLAHALLLVMGSIDVLFRAVRCMKFVGWRFGAAGNVALAVFALSWLGTRHVLFVRILYRYSLFVWKYEAYRC